MTMPKRPMPDHGITSSFELLHDPDHRDQALLDLGLWVIDTCMLFGSTPETAWQVAATFTKGLRRELENEKSNSTR
jgi:hypothetical protein